MEKKLLLQVMHEVFSILVNINLASHDKFAEEERLLKRWVEKVLKCPEETLDLSKQQELLRKAIGNCFPGESERQELAYALFMEELSSLITLVGAGRRNGGEQQ